MARKNTNRKRSAASNGSRAGASATAEAQLRSFIAKFDPPLQKLIRAVRQAVREHLAGANELVYDNYNFFVIGYSGTERPTDCILSIVANSSGVGLAFPFCGTRLPDPHKLLQGSGSKNRFIRVPSADVLSRPAVDSLIGAAVAASPPVVSGAKGNLIIRSISAKQRPRRKAAK